MIVGEVSGMGNMGKIRVELPGDVLMISGLERKNLSSEVKKRLAVTLYADGSLTLGSAASLAGMSYYDFWQYLGKYGLSINYTLEEFHKDMKTLEKL